MPLYRSEPAGQPRVWTHTQADAREAQGGKDYKTFDVPKKVPEILALLNDAEKHGFHGPAALTAPELPPVGTEEAGEIIHETLKRTRPKPVTEETVGTFAEGNERLGEPSKWQGNDADIARGTKCNACARTKRGSEIMAQNIDRGVLEELIEGIHEPHHLVALHAILEARLQELAPEGAAQSAPEAPEPETKPQPRPRTRTRNPVAGKDA